MELAEQLDMSQTQVSRYELGQNSPTAEVLVTIAKALDVRVEWLLGLTESMIEPASSEEGLSADEQRIVEALRGVAPGMKSDLTEIFSRIAGLASR